MNDWSLASVHRAIASAVPDREMLVCGDDRRTYGQVSGRTDRLASFLSDHGLGARQERSELERWQCGQDMVGLVMSNSPEYIESMLGCWKARAVPFNVNHHYTPGEVAALFAMMSCRAVIYQRALGPLVAATTATTTMGNGAGAPLLIEVEDGSTVAPLDGRVRYEDAIEAGGALAAPPEPSPDDLYAVCTGGTTGLPKGVLWRQADIFVSAMAGSEEFDGDQLGGLVEHSGGTWYAVPPLMHAAAQWTAFCGIHNGATIAVYDDRGPFDAATILATMERERVMVVSFIGDAQVRPIVEELRRTTYDLEALRLFGVGGAVTSQVLKDELLELVPHVAIHDGYGSSETGGMAFGAKTRAGTSGFVPAAGGVVLSADRSRLLDAGDDEVGWTARRGRVPLGYLGDETATAATFPIVDGERFAIPGDRAQLAADGTIVMLGRDSMVVNTGGEKVYVEEVEEVLRSHPDVLDALVVGQPSERWGQQVVAVVELQPDVTPDPAALREHCTTFLARFKAPHAFTFTPVQRHANGKANYAWAREAAVDAVPI